MAGLVGAYAVGEATSNNFTCDLDAHQVEYGDTLWGIAESKCEGDIQRVTDQLVDVYGTNIQAGQFIYLPENEHCHLRLNTEGSVFEDC